MPRVKKREDQPWLRYLVLPLILILFGLLVSYVLLAQQKQVNLPPAPGAPTPTPTPTPSKNQSEFVCPVNGWINCMPILTPEASKHCASGAIAWYKKNCPNFQGVAY